MNNIFKEISLRAKGSEIYIVGGWLRDTLLGKQNRDLDVITADNPIKLSKKIALSLKGRFVLLDKENKVYRVVLKNDPRLDYLDFSKMKGADIIKDLSNRDFTINSFAVPLREKISMRDLIDPFGGVKDLKAKKVRVTSRHAFTDDPLRILRAYRLASELGFTLTPETIKDIKDNASKIKQSAWERIRDELFKILASKNAHLWITELEKTNVLEALFPEIAEMKKHGSKFYYHPKGLWQHSTETLRALENILSKTEHFFPGEGDKILKHLSEPLSSGLTRETLLKIAALFHDVAKPATAKKIGGKMRFLGHEEKGAAKLSEILKRLRVASSDIKTAANLVAHHMRPISLTQANILTQRALFRFFRDIGDNTIDLIMLTLSDWHSYKGLREHKPQVLKKQEIVLKEIIRRYFQEKEKPAMPKIMDGNILMKKLKLVPGPFIGKLLAKIKEAQFLGKVKTSEEALSLARKILKK